jgi:hypothetical protein
MLTVRRLRKLARRIGWSTRDEQQIARHLLMAADIFMGILQVTNPLQTAIAIISDTLDPQWAGGDPSNDESWRAQVELAVSAVRWKIHDKAAQQELVRRATSRGRELQSEKRDELRTAILLALVDLTSAKSPVEIGQAWEDAWRWLVNRTCKLAEESLRGGGRTVGEWKTSRTSAALSLLEAEEALSSTDDPLYAVMRQEERQEDIGRVLEVLLAAPPREREAACLRLQGMSRSETAAAMGISENTLRVFLHRLAKRFRAA